MDIKYLFRQKIVYLRVLLGAICFDKQKNREFYILT